MRIIVVWVLNAMALLAVTYLIPGVYVANFWSALVAALFIGLANLFIRPLLILLTLPITLITLGLFILIINGVLFWVVGHVLQGFEVRTLFAGVLGAIVYSIVSWLLTAIVIDKEKE